MFSNDELSSGELTERRIEEEIRPHGHSRHCECLAAWMQRHRSSWKSATRRATVAISSALLERSGTPHPWLVKIAQEYELRARRYKEEKSELNGERSDKNRPCPRRGERGALAPNEQTPALPAAAMQLLTTPAPAASSSESLWEDTFPRDIWGS